MRTLDWQSLRYLSSLVTVRSTAGGSVAFTRHSSFVIGGISRPYSLLPSLHSYLFIAAPSGLLFSLSASPLLSWRLCRISSFVIFHCRLWRFTPPLLNFSA